MFDYCARFIESTVEFLKFDNNTEANVFLLRHLRGGLVVTASAS